MGFETTMKSNNVERTCNRFSRFLKERRCFGEVDFTSVITSPKGEIRENRELLVSSAPNKLGIFEKKSLDLFPLTSSSSNLNFEDSTQDLALSRNSEKSKEEPEKTTGSMTIIYDGKVLVFDGLHDEMAQEIMSLASQSVATTTQCETSQRNNNYSNTTHLPRALSDLHPIARGASLLRFMEKRKDRIAASAPYQVNNSYSSKQLFKKQPEHQLEFKLW